MFGWMKQQLEDEIDSKMIEYERISNERDEIKTEIIDSIDYRRLLLQIKSNKASIALYTIVTILLIIGGATISNIIYLFALLSVLKDIQEYIELNRNEKKINNSMYKEYTNMTIPELKNKTQELTDKYNCATKELEKISKNVQRCENSIKYLEEYEEQSEFLNTGATSVLAGDTYEEVLNTTRQYKKCMAYTLEDFLDEKVDYSTIYFDNNIELDKKLVKKM